MFIFERDRQRERERRERERETDRQTDRLATGREGAERETENPKQAPGSELSAQSPNS